MPSHEVEERASIRRPEGIEAGTYANIAASSWNQTDMRALTATAAIQTDVTGLLGDFQLFDDTAAKASGEKGYMKGYMPGAATMTEEADKTREVAKPQAALETILRGGVIKNEVQQADWRTTQQAHMMGQDESATDLYHDQNKKQSTQKFELFDSTENQSKTQREQLKAGNQASNQSGIAERLWALPLDKQAQVLSAGMVAYTQEMNHQQLRIAIGTVAGFGDGVVELTKGAESLGKSLCQAGQFSKEIAQNDPHAQVMAAEAGQAFGKLLVSGVKVWDVADNYLGSIGAASYNGDNTKVFRDIAGLGQRMNAAWEAMSPEEKTRLVTKLATENLGAYATGAGVQKLAKSMDVVGALQELGTQGSQFGAAGREAYEKMTGKLIEKLAVTPEGLAVKVPGDDKLLDSVSKMVGHFGEYVPERKPMFLAPGQNKVLNEREIEAFGGLKKLESMTDGELAGVGLKRFEMPKLKLETDEFSMKASIQGDQRAWLHASMKQEGVVELRFVKKGFLPDGTGGHFIADALKAHNAIPTERMLLKNIVNEESLEAFKAGALPEDTKVARMASKALRQLGLQPQSYRYEWNPQLQQLNIVIETGR